MTVIKNVVFVNKNKLKPLEEYAGVKFMPFEFSLFPIDIIHYLLPLKLKFLTETFVSIEDKKINGLMSVVKTGSRKVKITRILMGENSAKSGKLLVNYVVNAYLSKGAESFYAIVDGENLNLISMFKDALGFQNFAKEIVYKIEKKDIDFKNENFNFDYVKPMEFRDIKEVQNLINGTMFSYQKRTFMKSKTELRKDYFSKVGQYLLLDKNYDQILGYFRLQKINIQDYSLEFAIKPFFEAYAPDIIKYAELKLSTNKNFKNLYVKLESFYSNFTQLKESFDEEYKNSHQNEIFVKTYLVQKHTDFAFEKMVFNEATPAF